MPAQAGKRNLIGELSGYLKPTHLMQLVSALSQVWKSGTCKPFVSKRQGADLTDAPGWTATVSLVAI